MSVTIAVRHVCSVLDTLVLVETGRAFVDPIALIALERLITSVLRCMLCELIFMAAVWLSSRVNEVVPIEFEPPVKRLIAQIALVPLLSIHRGSVSDHRSIS